MSINSCEDGQPRVWGVRPIDLGPIVRFLGVMELHV